MGAADGHRVHVKRRRAASRVLLLIGILLAGALLFGLWHVVVGGLINRNQNAAMFGVGLAVLSGVLLGVTASGRRLLRD
jgi:hypothetical protein